MRNRYQVLAQLFLNTIQPQPPGYIFALDCILSVPEKVLPRTDSGRLIAYLSVGYFLGLTNEIPNYLELTTWIDNWKKQYMPKEPREMMARWAKIQLEAKQKDTPEPAPASTPPRPKRVPRARVRNTTKPPSDKTTK